MTRLARLDLLLFALLIAPLAAAVALALAGTRELRARPVPAAG